ncbi:cutinase family protein [Actinomadura parmotrematis]|uniref:Cutinase family protein n=1 Tax=Actinomadura parmotrematis TaxID=2864039 RepID=A0ABS7G2D9_9ACTN|nr:cutinase family protein [Actinomadura parmotrematis]MBW8486842.1 cutinase family protein [Actinomadura parmotrematis]
MSPTLPLRRLAAAAVACAAGAAGLTAVSATAASAATCYDVDVVFARGSGELPGLGIVGTPLVSGIKSDLPGRSVTSYAVNYAADLAQTSAGPGATDMSNHVKSVAASCPNTSFVLGGYSQGASVTDIAIGIPTLLGTGGTIPTNLSSRVKAVVVYGNPLRLYGQTINTASSLYGPKAKEFCNLGDPVCANGADITAHLTYPYNGTVTQGAQFAADKVKAG